MTAPLSESTVEVTIAPILKYRKLNPDLPDLKRGTEHSAGIDLYNAGNGVDIYPLKSAILLNGIEIEIPEGHFGLVAIRSGLGMKGLASHIGIIDSDFRGELKTKVFNHGGDPIFIARYDRIANLVIVPYATLTPLQFTELSDTIRGEGGYGSTGSQ